MRFRKKPVEIDAVRFSDHQTVYRWLKSHGDPDAIRRVTTRGDDLLIHTLEGDHTANPGDWIIRGVKGEYYPCKPDIFELTYEPVSALNLRM